MLANKPIITDDSATLEPALLKTLMEQISTLASVYHKPADTFVSRQRLAVQTVDSVAGRAFEEEEGTSAAAAAAQVGLNKTGWSWVWSLCCLQPPVVCVARGTGQSGWVCWGKGWAYMATESVAELPRASGRLYAGWCSGQRRCRCCSCCTLVGASGGPAG